MGAENFIVGKQDNCHHEGRRSTRRREDARDAEWDNFLRLREESHEPARRYFTIWQFKGPNYEDMKPMQHSIDLLIGQGDLYSQLTLEGKTEIYPVSSKSREPVDIDIT